MPLTMRDITRYSEELVLPLTIKSIFGLSDKEASKIQGNIRDRHEVEDAAILALFGEEFKEEGFELYYLWRQSKYPVSDECDCDE